MNEEFPRRRNDGYFFKIYLLINRFIVDEKLYCRSRNIAGKNYQSGSFYSLLHPGFSGKSTGRIRTVTKNCWNHSRSQRFELDLNYDLDIFLCIKYKRELVQSSSYRQVLGHCWSWDKSEGSTFHDPTVSINNKNLFVLYSMMYISY